MRRRLRDGVLQVPTPILLLRSLNRERRLKGLRRVLRSVLRVVRHGAVGRGSRVAAVGDGGDGQTGVGTTAVSAIGRQICVRVRRSVGRLRDLLRGLVRRELGIWWTSINTREDES